MARRKSERKILDNCFGSMSDAVLSDLQRARATVPHGSYPYDPCADKGSVWTNICVPRRRNSAGFRPARTLFTFRRRDSMRKWRNCNVLHTVWSPPFLLRNTQFLMVSRLKAPSIRDTAVSSCRVHVFIAECDPFCALQACMEYAWSSSPWLEMQELFIFPVAHGDSAGLRLTRTDLSSHEGARGESGETAPSCTRCGAHRKCDETRGYNAGC